MKEYKFTSDWFSNNIPNWDVFLHDYKHKPNLNFLEIGSYEGRSTIWLLENILTHPSSKISCIDLFNGEVKDNDMTTDPSLNLNYYETFKSNIKSFEDKVSIYKGYSYKILREFNPVPTYDLAYIDGAHTSYETLTDAVLLDPLIKIGGMIIFDDYLLKNPEHMPEQTSPELGVNAFCNVFGLQYEILYIGWQVILRKKEDIHCF